MTNRLNAKDSYFQELPGRGEIDEESIIPMDNGTMFFFPFERENENQNENEDDREPTELSMNMNVSQHLQNCPIDTMQKRRREDIHNNHNRETRHDCDGIIKHMKDGVAFRGFSDPKRDLEYDNVTGIGGEENFSFRQTTADGSMTNTAIGDWDFEEDQIRNMNGLVDDIYQPQLNSDEKGENGALFLKQFARNDAPVQNMSTNKCGQVYESGLLSGNMESSSVSQLFYSKKNIQALQDGIRYSVFMRSKGKHKIGEQSYEELIIIMKTMYLSHSKNQIYNVIEQVRELNKKVLDYSIPEVIEQLDMYDQYRHDKAFLPTPIDRSQSTSIKGERSLEMRGFF